MAYWIEGEKNPETIVFVHGFNSSHLTWELILPELTKKYRAVIYDQPGHGDSPAEGKDYSPKKMAARLKALFDALKIEKAHLVGHSMGGRTSVEFAATYPERVLSLSVADMHLLPIPQAKEQLPELFEKFDKVSAGLPNEFSNMEEATKALSVFYSASEIQFIVASLRKKVGGGLRLGSRPEVTNLYLAVGLSEDMTEQLKKIHVPFSFFAGDPSEESTVLKGVGVDHIRLHRPEVPVRIIKGSGHSVQRTALFAQELEEFIRRYSSPHL